MMAHGARPEAARASLRWSSSAARSLWTPIGRNEDDSGVFWLRRHDES
jgi:hypothetical protein